MRISKNMRLGSTDQRKEEFQPIFSPVATQGIFSGSTMKLSVLKLDGTSFNVVVLDTATVGELKAVLEETVNALQMKSLGYCDIKWDQVWGNFCLCYMNQKLLEDGATLRSIGIQHDDQINFVRHVSGQGSRRARKLMSCQLHEAAYIATGNEVVLVKAKLSFKE